MDRIQAMLAALSLAALAGGCAVSEQDKSEKEWRRAECNRVIDQDARERCLKQL